MKKIILCLCFFSHLAFAADPETVIFSFQKQKNPDEIQAMAKIVADFLTKHIGKKVEVLVPSSYGTTAQGLISKKVHVAYMDSLPYLLAARETPLEIIAVERRKGRTEYDSLVVVPVTSTAKTLNDLKGRSIAFTSQTSTSGYLFPFAKLVQGKLIQKPEDLNRYFSTMTYAGGYDRALSAVANGQADAAAFSDYVYEGPKADLYGTPETRVKVRVLARIPGVPTHLIAVSKDLSTSLRSKIQTSLLELAKEKPDLIASVYGASELVKPKAKVDHVERTALALKATGLDPGKFVK
jgi:phosphonate transport system substrate-binding protein